METKSHDLNCYLCQNWICTCNDWDTDKVICSDCIDKLEEETAELIKQKGILRERLDHFIGKYGTDLWS